MFDLEALERRLQFDKPYRDLFMNDPVGELSRLGVKISSSQAQLLKDSMDGKLGPLGTRPRLGIIAVLIG